MNPVESGAPISSISGAYITFAVLGGLTLLMGANHVSPGCTGSVVTRCDYVATAKAANADVYYAFDDKFGFNIFDHGSSVLVQQSYPFEGIIHGSSVLIDKRSCRACEVSDYLPASSPLSLDRPRGRLIKHIPPTDMNGAAEFNQKLRSIGVPYHPDF